MSLSNETENGFILPEIDYLYDNLLPYYKKSKLKLLNEDTFKHKMSLVHEFMEIIYFNHDDVWFNEVELAIALSISELSKIKEYTNTYTYQSVRLVKEIPKLYKIFRNDSVLVPIEVDNVFNALSTPSVYIKDSLNIAGMLNKSLLTHYVREIDEFGQFAYRVNEESIISLIDDKCHDIFMTEIEEDKLELDDIGKKKLVLKRLLNKYNMMDIYLLKYNNYYKTQYDKLGKVLTGIYDGLKSI